MYLKATDASRIRDLHDLSKPAPEERVSSAVEMGTEIRTTELQRRVDMYIGGGLLAVILIIILLVILL
jgi:hypothetical protein